MYRCVIIISITLLFLFSTINAQPTGKKLTVADIFNSRKFTTKDITDLCWSADGKSFCYRVYDKEENINKVYRYDNPTNSTQVIVDLNKITDPKNGKAITVENTIWPPDLNKVLFTEKLRSRRAKSSGNFLLYDLKNGLLKWLTETDKEQVNVKFSPDGNKIAFIRENNLFVTDLNSQKETQLTFDGKEHVLTGHFDWVYEEEFSIIDGWRWSPDGNYIAYWQLDESRVPKFDIAEYDSLHLNWNNMRYPKAGDPNSIVKIGVVNINSKRNVWMDIGDNDDIYIPRIYWHPDSKQLVIIRMNRLQNQLDMLLADVKTGDTKTILHESNNSWIEIKNDFTVLEKSNTFLLTSEQSGFRHIYLYDFTGKLIRQVTKGQWEIRDIEGVDEEAGLVFFTAAKESPLENHLYATDYFGNEIKQISHIEGWHSIEMAPFCDYYIDEYSNAYTPTKTAIFDNTGNIKKMVFENDLETMKEYQLSVPEFFTLTTSEGIDLNAWMIKPVDFDANNKYPLLMYVYGGPRSQSVRKAWRKNNLWYQLLAQKGYIIACVDGRGTGGRGAEFKKIVYKQLGHFETIDQIEGAKYFGSLDFIDKNRIGIWGWSYGGFMSSLCLFRGNDVFKAAIAVAPVTNFRFYDTIYTERYMQTPKLNPDGYDNNAPVTYAKDLKGNFLLVHGTSDDNVHFQNSVVLANELIKHNKQFQTMYYPGRYHGIRGKAINTSEHIYTLMTDFILNNL